jgi:hypothetical protein
VVVWSVCFQLQVCRLPHSLTRTADSIHSHSITITTQPSLSLSLSLNFSSTPYLAQSTFLALLLSPNFESRQFARSRPIVVKRFHCPTLINYFAGFNCFLARPPSLTFSSICRSTTRSTLHFTNNLIKLPISASSSVSLFELIRLLPPSPTQRQFSPKTKQNNWFNKKRPNKTINRLVEL